MDLQDYVIIAERPDDESLVFAEEQFDSLQYRKYMSMIAGRSDDELKELMIETAAKVQRSPKEWKSAFSAMETDYGTRKILKVMRNRDPEWSAVVFAEDTLWKTRENDDDGYDVLFKDPNNSPDGNGRVEIDPNYIDAACNLVSDFAALVSRRYYKRVSFKVPKESKWYTVYKMMEADGCFLSDHVIENEDPRLNPDCVAHYMDMLYAKYEMEFPALIRHIASEMPKLLRESETLSELMQGYRVSILTEKREQYASATEWVEFYFSRPIESDSLKKSLYFLLT